MTPALPEFGWDDISIVVVSRCRLSGVEDDKSDDWGSVRCVIKMPVVLLCAVSDGRGRQIKVGRWIG